MIIASLPFDEDKRLEALQKYEILYTDFEQNYDDIVKIAALICGTPIALISFSDRSNQWYKAKIGWENPETNRDLVFCSHAILNTDQVFVVEDALLDERFFDNPLVTQKNPSIRFYAGAPLVTPDGCALGTLCTIDSQPKQLTQEQKYCLQVLARQIVTQLELKSASKKITKDYQELEELNISKDKFFSIISHDLRSPFNTLLNFAKILKFDSENMDRKEILKLAGFIYNSAQSSSKLIETLLQWSSIEKGQVKVNLQKINLKKLIDESISVMKNQAENKNITLKLSMINDKIKVLADKNMLFSVLQNLIGNAIKFTAKQGKVLIQVLINNCMAQIDIIDNGIGMSKKQIKKLFNIGSYESRKGTMGETGTGLGLLLSKEFVENNGGQIWVQSQTDEGLTFSFTIPIAPSE